MAWWRIITKPGCSYCVRAKALLRENGQVWIEDLRDTPEKQQAFRDAGYKTYPQIFREEVLIGGFQELDDYLGL